jgi:hypothetical protein
MPFNLADGEGPPSRRSRHWHQAVPEYAPTVKDSDTSRIHVSLTFMATCEP